MDAAIKQFNNKPLTNLRYVIFGGETLNFIRLRNWLDLYGYDQPKLINMYGITETTVHVTYKKITEKDLSQSSRIGVAIPDLKLLVLDKNLMPLPIGAIGELYVGGNGLARGYLNQPNLTKEKFILNPFQTKGEKTAGVDKRLYKSGDLVRILPDGELEYIGRNDSQVKIRGYRIELGDIESKLTSYPGIKQAVIIVKEEQIKHLIAYYVADKKLDEAEILLYLATQLPEYMLPKILVYLSKIPLTINGKLDQQALPKPKLDNSKKYVAPGNEREQLICKAFAKVLGREKISIDDDFFTLGGNSIQAIQLAVALQANFDVKVANIFNLRTPRRIAENTYFGKNMIKQKLEQVKLSYQNKPRKNPIVDKRLQNTINCYLKDVSNLQINCSIQKPIVNVLLTGATGYLGCNILNQLLTLTNYKIYLLVRAPSQEEAIKRLNKKYLFYFDKMLDDWHNLRIFTIKSDIEKNNLDLSGKSYQVLVTEIDSIIHAAALVKHYGDYDKFYSANVQATINLLKLAKLTKQKDFHYISTYSVLNCGFVPNYEEYTYTEDDFPDNLKLWDNTYIQTKLLGERQVIKYRSHGINSNIYRISNLAFMSENYRTQENIEDNAFFNWLKCLFKMRCTSYDLNLVEISQTDLTAQAIVKLFDKKHLVKNTYHVFNPHPFNISNVFADNRRLSIKTLSMEEFIDNIARNLSSETYHNLIIKFLLYQGWLDEWNVKSATTVKVLQNRTQCILEQLDFKWPIITNEVFNKYLELLKLSGVDEMTKKPKIFEYLEILAPIIPANAYWFDRNNVVLGANLNTIKAIGGLSVDEFIGKTPYEYYSHEVADNIVRHHKEVVNSGKPFSYEESIRDLTTNEVKYFNAIIAPLWDDGKLVGSVGISTDITAEKEAERLKFENLKIESELQQAKLREQEQEKFKTIANQLVHDIRSPASSLKMLVGANREIPESLRTPLMEIATSINDIANSLLIRYKADAGGSSGSVS